MSSYISNFSKSYLLVALASFAFLIGITSVINFTVDPGGIYHQDKDKYQYLATTSLDSKYGVILPSSTDDRKYKKSVALNLGKADCVIIGSSHVMQASSHRDEKFFPEICNAIINLGVSGATLEDYIILSSLVMRNKSAQRGLGLKFIFGIDPWSMGPNRDMRWINYGDDEVWYINNLMGNDNKISAAGAGKISNLINFDYLVRSVSLLVDTALTEKEIIIVNHPVDPEKGIEDYVTLPDLSIVYSEKVLNSFRAKPIVSGGENYKSSFLEESSAMELFENHIRGIRDAGYSVIFLMTPYAPNVFMADSETKKQLEHMEPIIRGLANTLNIPLYGSFNPSKLNCLNEDFYDHMHPKASCLAKIPAN